MPQDCELEFKTDSENLKGTLSALNISVGGDHTTTAIRQVSEPLMAYAFYHRKLCEDWNSCAVDKDSYRRESELCENVIGHVVGLKDRAEKATDDEKKQLVEDAAQGLFTLDFKVVAYMPKAKPPESPCPTKEQPEPPPYDMDPSPKIIGAGDPLPTGAHAIFTVTTSAPVYVYLLQRKHANGEINVIFPDPQLDVKNPIRPDVPLELPPPNSEPRETGPNFCLDQHDMDMDKLFVVASRTKLESLDAAMDKIRSGDVKTIDRADQAVQALDQIPTARNDIPPNCTRSRGFVYSKGAEPGAAASCPPKSRGFVLQTHGAQAKEPGGSSFTAVSDAGPDAMLIKAFPYNHVDWDTFASGKAPPLDVPPEPGKPRSRDIMIEQ